MAKNLYANLNPKNKEEKDQFRFKADKTTSTASHKPSKKLFSKFKTLIQKPNKKIQSTSESQTDDFNLNKAGGFDLSPMPQHNRGASFFIGVSKNPVLPSSRSKNAHTMTLKRGSIKANRLQCSVEGCTEVPVNFISRLCLKHDPVKKSKNKINSENKDINSHKKKSKTGNDSEFFSKKIENLARDSRNIEDEKRSEEKTEYRRSLLEDEDFEKKSLSSGILQLYKSWSYSVEQDDSDTSIITWNFILDDSHYTTMLKHSSSSSSFASIGSELVRSVVSITLNGVSVLVKEIDIVEEAKRQRFTVKPEDCSFVLDYTVEPVKGSEGCGFVYGMFVDRSPFEKCLLRWVRDKVRKQLDIETRSSIESGVSGNGHIGSGHSMHVGEKMMLEKGERKSDDGEKRIGVDTQELTKWKHYVTEVGGKKILKAVYYFVVDGEEHSVVVERGKNKVICFVDRNRIDLSDETHTVKKGGGLFSRKPKLVRFMCNFKVCELGMNKNDKGEVKFSLSIDGVPFYVFKWVLNNL